MSLEKLTESSCVACREDAPLVTQEEIEEFISFLNLNNLNIKKTVDEVKSLVVQK